MSDGQFYPLGDREVPFQFGSTRGVILPGCRFVFQPASGAYGRFALLEGFTGADDVCLKVFKDELKEGKAPPYKIKHEVEALRSQKGIYAPAFVCLGKAVVSKNEKHWAIVQENLKGYLSFAEEVQVFWGNLAEGDGSYFQRYIGVLLSVSRAIESVHRSGHVHRDLSPRNVMVGAKVCPVPDVRLIDFGEANERYNYIGTLGLKDLHLGTFGYSAPEVFDLSNRKGRASKSTSVYSLGALAFLAATGNVPHNDEIVAEQERLEAARIDELTRFILLLRAVSNVERSCIPLTNEHRRLFGSSDRMRRVLLFIDMCTLPKTAWRPTIEECKSLLGRLIDVNVEGVSRSLALSSERLGILMEAASREFAEGDGSESNFRRVAALASFCADAGSTEAALLAGTSLERLDGMISSCDLQLTYYRMAADGGSPAGMTAAARIILARANSTNADSNYALKLLSEASAAGNVFAERLLRQYS